MKNYLNMSVLVVFLLVQLLLLTSCADTQRMEFLETQIAELQAEKEAQTEYSEEILEYVTQALNYQELLLQEYINISLFDTNLEFPASLEEFQAGGENSIANAQGQIWRLREEIKLSYSPPATLGTKESLLEETYILEDASYVAWRAWSQKSAGDTDEYMDSSRELSKFLREFSLLQRKNEFDLLNIKLQAERDLGQ
ncbi:hypothetical protein ACFLYV_00260 [Chloroflexota bacterium]